MEKHIEIIERMMFVMATHKVDGIRIMPTLKAAKDALEKQMLKRPKIKSFPKINGFELRCPNSDCGAVLQSDSPCCRYCGQALDWSDIE